VKGSSDEKPKRNAETDKTCCSANPQEFLH
jgi:hypothetical protein